MDKKLELLAKYGFTAESLNFEFNDMSLEEFEQKLIDLQAQKQAHEFALSGQFVEELLEKLGQEKITEEWGTYSKYGYVDHDVELSEVYCWDRTDWKLYGFSYSVAGDAVSVDFNTKKRKKFSIVDFIDGSKDESFELCVKDIIEVIKNTSEAKYTQLNTEFDTYKQNYSTKNEEVEELRNFKATKIKDEFDKSVEDLFTEFNEKLGGFEDYEALKENHEGMTLDEISDKCFMLVGKKEFKLTNKKQLQMTKQTIVPPITQPVQDEPYNGLFTKFAKNKK